MNTFFSKVLVKINKFLNTFKQDNTKNESHISNIIIFEHFIKRMSKLKIASNQYIFTHLCSVRPECETAFIAFIDLNISKAYCVSFQF